MAYRRSGKDDDYEGAVDGDVVAAVAAAAGAPSLKTWKKRMENGRVTIPPMPKDC